MDCPHRAREVTDIVYGGTSSMPTQMAEVKKRFVPPASEFNIYWGELHGHSNLSDGTIDIDSYFQIARDNAKLDFCALTDHDHGGVGRPQLWVAGKWELIQDKVSEYFEMDRSSPYMLLVADVKEERRLPQPSKDGIGILERLKVRRSDIPAVTHLDYSARIQTVNQNDKPDYYEVISEFEKFTGCAVVVNTSFNVRGEPIICTPQDAYRCFMRTEMDVLVIEDFILFKEEQPQWKEGSEWRRDLILD